MSAVEIGDQPGGDVVILGSVPYQGHQLYDQRLARALAARGHDVVYVEPAVPVIRVHKWHRGLDRTRTRTSADGIVVLTPQRLPAGTRPVFAWSTGLSIGFAAWRHARRRPKVAGVIACAAQPMTLRLLRRWPVVAVVKDDYAAGSDLTGQPARTVLRRRRKALSLADAVAVVSPTLKSILLRDGIRSRVVPAGCELRDRVRTGAHAELDAVARPRAVFIGMLSNRIDFEILRAVVESGWELVLVGRRQFRFSEQETFDALMASGRVVELGEHDPDHVASVVAQCDVGLVPYTLSDFNVASFPLKTLEYLAEGVPVLATALPGVLWLDTEAVSVVADPTEVSAALAALTGPAAERLSGMAREVAARHTWEQRAQQYESMLAGVTS